MNIKKHPLIYSILIAMALAVLYIMLTKTLFINTDNPFLEETFKKLIIAITITILFCILRAKGSIGTPKLKQNLWKGLKDGWLFLLIGAINLLSFSTRGAYFRPISHIICFVISIILTGIWEELLFRGIILSLCKHNSASKNRIDNFFPVIISALIFSLFHLLNIAPDKVTISSVVVQMISVFFTGIYYGAIYTRSSNILSLILLHTFQDITALLHIGLLQDSGDISAAISALSPELALASIVFVIPAIWPVVKNKLETSNDNK
ncbi:CPBP family intramembrane glutamic endopeptidase [Ruminococcus sp.]|uniref:CPBP family intramembrane glutamic endopeptidase n=1 Tax=Ruminococcus sp. TaxID=41978 RepID=UPI0025D27A77|nr:CPBP family intramembrane glutamic endopeptidase [Ruminococcus sp.]